MTLKWKLLIVQSVVWNRYHTFLPIYLFPLLLKSISHSSFQFLLMFSILFSSPPHLASSFAPSSFPWFCASLDRVQNNWGCVSRPEIRRALAPVQFSAQLLWYSTSVFVYITYAFPVYSIFHFSFSSNKLKFVKMKKNSIISMF